MKCSKFQFSKCNDCFKQQKSINRIKTKWIREDQVSFLYFYSPGPEITHLVYRIHDDVVKWVKSIQKAVGEAGDILLNDVDINFGQSVDKVKFVGNKEFLSLITKDQVGYLQVAELCPGDAKLDLVTPIPELRSGAVVRCSLVSTHLASAISIAVYQGGKEIHGKLIENLSHMCL